ncbi:hypothetical protein [Parachitinimonas caeni]|uniref:Uncharacterized protein n=1 Tax=Parachitinimonas caeni TaxID=3031301 RepID=A0ABT7DYY5_9NEIS|nr:hypothetical protein [Parachitinimonas caeni]MDK2124283.1 hypothetical protein [Parachitinimonas caeni]
MRNFVFVLLCSCLLMPAWAAEAPLPLDVPLPDRAVNTKPAKQHEERRTAESSKATKSRLSKSKRAVRHADRRAVRHSDRKNGGAVVSSGKKHNKVVKSGKRTAKKTPKLSKHSKTSKKHQHKRGKHRK